MHILNRAPTRRTDSRQFANSTARLWLIPLLGLGCARPFEPFDPPPTAYQDPVRRELAEILAPCERHLAEAQNDQERRRRRRRIATAATGVAYPILFAAAPASSTESHWGGRPEGAECTGGELDAACALSESANRGMPYGADPSGDTTDPTQATSRESMDALSRIDRLLESSPDTSSWSDEDWSQYERERDALRRVCNDLERQR